MQFFPSYIATNVLTFLGFSLTVVNFILIGCYDYHFKAATFESNPIPKVIWIIAAFNMFTAYTLDGLDGKQARKIGISGPVRSHNLIIIIKK